MMKIYENDDLVISQKYKAMSISELEEEKDRLLRVLRVSDRPKKKIGKNKNNLNYSRLCHECG